MTDPEFFETLARYQDGALAPEASNRSNLPCLKTRNGGAAFRRMATGARWRCTNISGRSPFACPLRLRCAVAR